MTNEESTTDVPISDWTLATGTKPGARHVYWLDTQRTARHGEPEANASQERSDTSRQTRAAA